MKKVLFLAGISILLLTGCGAKEQKTMTCTRTVNQSGMKMDLSYEVKYTGDYVDTVKSVEKIESDNAEVLKTYKETVESMYSAYDNIKYYDYDVVIDGNTLTSTVNINYSKIDTDKLLEVDSALGQLIKDGKVSIDDIESVYNAVGAICERD